MKDFFLRILVSGFAVLITSNLLSGVHIDTPTVALIVALVLSVLNAFVKPLLILLTIPLTLVTFGLFLVIINAIMIEMTDYLVAGFQVESFAWSLLFSLILSMIMSAFDALKRRNEEEENSGR